MSDRAIKNKKTIILLILLIIPIVFLATMPIITISYNLFTVNSSSDPIDKIIQFNEPELDLSNKKIWENLSNNALSQTSYYKQSIINDLQNKAKEIDAAGAVIDTNMNPRKLAAKNSNTDGIYLGFQVFGYATPSVSINKELNRWEISNFSALQNAGYTLYINYDNSKNIFEILNIDKEYINNNLPNKVLYSDSDTGGVSKEYYQIANINNSDSLYFKTTQNVSSNDIGNSININFIAVNNDVLDVYQNSQILNVKDDILKPLDPIYNNDSRKKLTITIRDNQTLEFVQWKLWEYMMFDYSQNSQNPRLYAASLLLNIYTEAGMNLMQYLDPSSDSYHEKIEVLAGLGNIYQAGLGIVDGNVDWDNVDSTSITGTRSADLLYYAYKYSSIYDLFLFKQRFSFGDADVYLTLDQNMPIANNEDNLKSMIKTESQYNNLKNIEHTKDYIKSLPYNPWFSFDDKLFNFTEKVWNKVFEIQEIILN